MALAAAAVIGNANHRHRRAPNCHRESCVSTESILTSIRLSEYDLGPVAPISVNTKVLHQFNPRTGFTPVSGDWIKGLVLNCDLNLWC